VHIRWLREKIEADPSAPDRIVTRPRDRIQDPGRRLIWERVREVDAEYKGLLQRCGAGVLT